MARKPYPSDVTDEEWDFVAPYLTLMTEDAPQRRHDLREVFNGLRYVVRGGGQAWRMTPNNLPPWPAVYQQAQRWIAAGVFEAMAHGPAPHPAGAGGPARGAAGGGVRQPHPAVDARERRPGRIRRGQAAQGLENGHVMDMRVPVAGGYRRPGSCHSCGYDLT